MRFVSEKRRAFSRSNVEIFDHLKMSILTTSNGIAYCVVSYSPLVYARQLLDAHTWNSLYLSTWLQESTCDESESEHLHFEMSRPSFLRIKLFKAVAEIRETKSHVLCAEIEE